MGPDQNLRAASERSVPEAAASTATCPKRRVLDAGNLGAWVGNAPRIGVLARQSARPQDSTTPRPECRSRERSGWRCQGVETSALITDPRS